MVLGTKPQAWTSGCRMHFMDVAVCSNLRCGAILRITPVPGAFSVPLQTDVGGAFLVCPRCGRRMRIELPDVSPAALAVPTLTH